MTENSVGLRGSLNVGRTEAAHPATPVSVEELARDAAWVAAGPARSTSLRWDAA